MWVVHPIAAVLLAMYTFNVWRGSRDGNRVAVILAALMMVLSVLGASWVVHPAAGLSLAACWLFVGGGFAKRRNIRPVRALITACAFGVMGAGWVFIPLSVAAVFGLMGGFRRNPKFTLDKPKQATNPAPVVVSAPVVNPMPQVPQTLTVLAQSQRLPSDSAKRAKALNLQCFEALAYINERGPGGARLKFEVEQIQHDFAPEAIGAYLALPPSTANVTPLRDGKTGQDLLNEQLDLLSDGVHSVMQRAEELGAEQILASHTFVQAKFAREKTSELHL